MDRILLTNAQVLTCTGAADEHAFAGEVLVEDGKIAAVAASSMGVSAEAVRRVDCHGATLLPGLGDGHVHISWPLDFVFDHNGVAAEEPARHALDVAAVVRTFLESGYTTIVGAGVSQPQDDILTRTAIEAGDIPGPRIVPSGPMITAPGCLGADAGLMEVAADAEELRTIVARQCDEGARAIKLFISGDGIVPEFPSNDVYMNDGMLEAAVREADRHGAFITTHARGAESVTMAARCGVRLIHHACFIDDATIRALQDRGDDVWVCPGLHYMWAMTQGHAESWGMTQDRIRQSGYDREFAAQVEGIRALAAAGIALIAGGDFGHQWTRHGTYAAELQRYVDQCGLSALAALHTATRNFGALLGEAIGEIRPGAEADLLLVDGDPLADIRLLQDSARRRAVMKGGRFAWLNPSAYP